VCRDQRGGARVELVALGNIEILIGFTAPLIAWIATRGARGRRIALAWNVVGPLVAAERRHPRRPDGAGSAELHPCRGPESRDGDLPVQLHPLVHGSARHDAARPGLPGVARRFGAGLPHPTAAPGYVA
jgi:hypothetical protein